MLGGIGAALGDLAVLAHFAAPSGIPFNLHLWPVRPRPFRSVSLFTTAPPQAWSHTAPLNKPCFSASPSVVSWSDLLPKLTFQPSTRTTIAILGSSTHLTPALGILYALICKPKHKRKGAPDSTVAINRSPMSLMAACNNNRCSHNFTH